MNTNFFRTLWATASVSSFSVGIFTVLVVVAYSNPLNSTPKGFDWLFFLAFPIWAILYYKFKVNQGDLDIREGLVMGALVSFSMFLTTAIIILVASFINENMMSFYIQDWLQDLRENKNHWVQKVKNPAEYEKMLVRYKEMTIGKYLFLEFGYKMMLLLFVSVIAATALRGKTQKSIPKNIKKKK